MEQKNEQAGKPTPSSGAGAFNRVERFRNDMRAINERWEQLSVVKGVCLADQYLQHGLNIAALFQKMTDGTRFICLVSCRVDEGEIHGEWLTGADKFDPVPSELSEQKQVPVLVRVGQSIQAPDRVVASLGRVYFVTNYFGEIAAGPLYLSKRTGFYESIPCLVDRKRRSMIGAASAVHDFAGGVIKRGPKDLDSGASQQGDIGGDGSELACLDTGLNFLYVLLTGNDVSVGFDVAFDTELELVDVMVGPFDL